MFGLYAVAEGVEFISEINRIEQAIGLAEERVKSFLGGPVEANAPTKVGFGKIGYNCIPAKCDIIRCCLRLGGRCLGGRWDDDGGSDGQ